MISRTLPLLALLGSVATAAPPTVTTLTPAGGARGTTVIVTVAGTFDQWPVRVWSSSPGVTAKAEKDKGKFAVTLAADAPLGPVWLRFHDDTGASALRPFVVGGLPEAAEAEPNDNPTAVKPVTLPTVVNGILGKTGDVDCFAVKLARGQTLVASLDAHRSLRSPMDGILQLLAADGTVLKQNHDARGLDPEVVHTATADGIHVVRLFAFPATPDSSIRHFGSAACLYRLTLTVGEFVDFVTPLAVESDREATLTLHGWNLGSPSHTLGRRDDRVGTANPVTVLRESHPCFDRPEKPLTPPFTVTGRVGKANAPSVLTVNAPAGKPLAVRLESATLGLSLNPVLMVTDTAGKVLLRAEPAALHGTIDAKLTPPAAGPLRFEVRDLLNTAGPRHVYRLRVVPIVPDIEAKVAADRFTVAAGGTLDIPITITRADGFADELVPFATDLPDGVTAEPTPPSAKPTPNTLTLRLTAKTAGASGPIRLGVTKKGDSGFRRFAVAPLSEFDCTHSFLWLTTTAAPAKK